MKKFIITFLILFSGIIFSSAQEKQFQVNLPVQTITHESTGNLLENSPVTKQFPQREVHAGGGIIAIPYEGMLAGMIDLNDLISIFNNMNRGNRARLLTITGYNPLQPQTSKGYIYLNIPPRDNYNESYVYVLRSAENTIYISQNEHTETTSRIFITTDSDYGKYILKVRGTGDDAYGRVFRISEGERPTIISPNLYDYIEDAIYEETIHYTDVPPGRYIAVDGFGYCISEPFYLSGNDWLNNPTEAITPRPYAMNKDGDIYRIVLHFPSHANMNELQKLLSAYSNGDPEFSHWNRHFSIQIASQEEKPTGLEITLEISCGPNLGNTPLSANTFLKEKYFQEMHNQFTQSPGGSLKIFTLQHDVENIYLSNSQYGVEYLLYRNGIHIKTFSGNGNSLIMHTTEEGRYVAKAKYISGETHIRDMAGEVHISTEDLFLKDFCIDYPYELFQLGSTEGNYYLHCRRVKEFNIELLKEFLRKNNTGETTNWDHRLKIHLESYDDTSCVFTLKSGPQPENQALSFPISFISHKGKMLRLTQAGNGYIRKYTPSYEFTDQSQQWVNILLNGSQPEVLYQLHRNGQLYKEIKGSGEAISFCNISADNSYVIIAKYRNMSEMMSGVFTFPVTPHSIGSDDNYVIETVYNGKNGSHPYSDITYFDGLGYPVQTINHLASPLEEDIITHLEYDNLRNESKKYLPYIKTANSGRLDKQADYHQKSYYTSIYGVDHPYSYNENIYDNSPLSRTIKSYGPGPEYRTNGEKAIGMEYGTNQVEDSVRKFRLQADNNILLNHGYFEKNTLLKNTIINEDGIPVIIFTIPGGKSILQRVYFSENEYSDTYSIYDEMGEVRWVITPEGSSYIQRTDQSSYTCQNELGELYCYIYSYDNQGRLQASKTPGKGWDEFVYDKGKREVMSRNPNLANRNQWFYKVYDNHHRIVAQHLVTSPLTREQLQNRFDQPNFSNIYEHPGNYAENSLPFQENEVSIHTTLSITKYGDYNHIRPEFKELPPIIQPESQLHGVRRVNLDQIFFLKFNRAKLNSINFYPRWVENFPYINKDGTIDSTYFITSAYENNEYFEYYYLPVDNEKHMQDLYRLCGSIAYQIYERTALLPDDIVPVQYFENMEDVRNEQDLQYLIVPVCNDFFLDERCSNFQWLLNYIQKYTDYYVDGNGNINPAFKIPESSLYYLPADDFLTYFLRQFQSSFPCIATEYPEEVFLRSEVLCYNPDIYDPAFKSPSFLHFKSFREITDQSIDKRVKGLPIYEKEIILNDHSPQGPPLYVEKAFYYDQEGRPLQVVKKNHLGGISRISTLYNFSGNVIKQYEQHSISPDSPPDLLIREYEYDHRGRILREVTTLNGGEQASVRYNYNERGELIGKTYGSYTPFKENLEYTIQGWLKKIDNDFFTMELNYFHPHAGNFSSYNGNISSWQWRHKFSPDSVVNLYTFRYDGSGRLQNARYYKNMVQNGDYDVDLLYSKNSNILSINRKQPGDSALYLKSYAGSRLISVTKSNDRYDYSYDANGNCIRDGLNETDLEYNFLDRVSKINHAEGTTTYHWQVNGTKSTALTSNGQHFEYLGSMIYKKENGKLVLESAGFSSGRIFTTHAMGGTIFAPDYFFTDHLGSVRTVIDRNGNILQTNDYYPYGLRWPDRSSQTNTHRWSYNGKESQRFLGTRYIDYGSRFYDQVLIHWNAIDPRAHDYYSFSPFGYCMGNPLKFIDPDGEKIDFYENHLYNGTMPAYLHSVHDQEFDRHGWALTRYYNANGEVVGYAARRGSALLIMNEPDDLDIFLNDIWRFTAASNLYMIGGGFSKGKLAMANGDIWEGLKEEWKEAATNPEYYLDVIRIFGVTKAAGASRAAKGGVQYTKSSLKLGQEMHKGYKAGLADGVTTFKEFTRIKGIRPDFVDLGTKTIYELKPFNPRQIQLGTKQLNNYKSLFEQKYGGTWKTVLDTY